MNEKRYFVFIIPDSVARPLTYSVPVTLNVSIGSLCNLSIQKRQQVGLCYQEVEKPDFACKDVLSVVEYAESFSKHQIQLLEWLASYYCAPLGRMLRCFAPGFVWNVEAQEQRKKRFLKQEKKEEKTSLVKGEKEARQSPVVTLSDEQQKAVDKAFEEPEKPLLLFGVTGSGKTEVYLEIAKKILAQEKSVLILVPEIALTPQMTGRFRQHFKDDLAVFHSSLTPVEYERDWFRVQRGEARVCLGVRSAVFAPLRNIGLIIVDEEHDTSYKSEEFPCYQARDVAVLRSHFAKAMCVLGTATPSLESYFNVQNGKYRAVTLNSKYSQQTVEVEILNARDTIVLHGVQENTLKITSKVAARSSFVRHELHVLDDSIVERIRHTQEIKQQSMILLNRRGHANYAMCFACSTPLLCPHCSVSTTLHERGTMEACHYCGFRQPTRKQCAECGAQEFMWMGTGTQSIVESLQEKIPQLRIERLDRDVITSHSRLSEIIHRIRDKEVDCVVGTQLLAKGHDFPSLNCVTLLYIDDGLFWPDYRAAEKTFQLIVQSIGRAGRGKDAGKVYIQSLVPQNPVLLLASEIQVVEFLERELKLRKLAGLPPYSRQILFEFEEANESRIIQDTMLFKNKLTEYFEKNKLTKQIYALSGPLPAPLSKINKKFRYHLSVSFSKSLSPYKICAPIMDLRLKTKVRIDVDPFNFM